MQDLLQPIQNSLQKFVAQADLQQTATDFWHTLGYKSNKTVSLAWADLQAQMPSPTQAEAEAMPYVQEACMVFQITEAEMSAKVSMFATNAYNASEYQSYLFLACRLQDRDYKRETLATLTRLINKPFGMPVIVLFVQAGKVSIGVINRRLNQKDAQKDVLEKVTLLKDIDTKEPKRSQLDILQDLALPALQTEHKVKNFVDLHQAWQKVLDTKMLNKRFFGEIANWYFWAVESARFPALPTQTQEQANQVAVIRLLTRLMFVWFIKEKGLVKDDIFNQDKVQEYLTGFEDWQAFFEKEYQIKLAEKDKNKFFHSQYYKAVLQNVFFASLNADIQSTDKHFIKNCTKQRKDTSHSAGAVYRYRYFFKDEQKALQDLFLHIPFLNGGLFDALEQGNTKIDGFTNPIENQDLLQVPDFLFFAEENANFSDALKKIYDIKDKKNALKVKGILNILKRYKFTVQENTPLEEDVALDPELLGQIFENLLAYYNPETGATARKGTGSFYTPREIVDYMVEESLKAYLKIDNLEAIQQASQEEKERVIRQLANIKILDPACGSGAFPMGVLHKIVDILKMMDKDNAIWRKIQKERAQAEIDLAYDIKEREERQARLHEIDEVFENNLEDYGRKLFIIQNCIYGVDIQNIAIQISKLRFFLSLVIEQKNEHIKPLPNLETKFVCANTLIALDKPKGQAKLKNPQIETLEKDLGELRTRYFRIRNRQAKKNLIAQDETLRQELATLLQGDGWGKTSANKIASFNLFDQNASADWFDADMMFGVKEGFDVVLGNPPYVSLQKMNDTQALKKAQYKTFENMGDLYSLFYEKGFYLLASDGVLCFITSNKWINANYGKSTRKFIAENTNPLVLIDFGKVKIFETATVFTNILLYQKARNQQSMQACTVQGENLPENLPAYFAKHCFTLSKLDENIWKVNNSTSLNINEVINEKGTPLSEWTDIKFYRGITTGFNDAFHIPEETKNELIAQDANSAEIIKPLLRGKDIKRWKYKYEDLHIIFTKQGIDIKKYPEIEKFLRKEYYEDLVPKKNPDDKRGRKQGTYKWYEIQDNTAYYTEFSKPKIVWIEISDKANYAYDERGMYLTNSAYFMVGKSLKYLLAVLNSSVADYYFFQITARIAGGRKRYTKQYVEQVPVPIVGEEAEKPFEKIVDYILFLKEYPENQEARIALLHFEGVLNAMVYELYFVEQVRKANHEILAHIGELPCLLPSDSPETKMCMVLDIYAKTYHKDHPIRNSVFFMSVIPEVAEIINTLKREKTEPETETEPIEENEN